MHRKRGCWYSRISGMQRPTFIGSRKGLTRIALKWPQNLLVHIRKLHKNLLKSLLLLLNRELFCLWNFLCWWERIILENDACMNWYGKEGHGSKGQGHTSSWLHSCRVVGINRKSYNSEGEQWECCQAIQKANSNASVTEQFFELI